VAELIEQAYEVAVEVLRLCLHEKGIKAAEAYYPQVWARDGVIASFGALLIDDAAFDRACRASLELLAGSMNDVGHVANCLPVDVEYTPGVNNAVDSNCWLIIGHWYYWKLRRNADFASAALPDLRRAARWLRYQDWNDCGLLEVHECSDWADLFANRYNALGPNVLYAMALRCLGELCEAAGEPDAREYADAATDVIEKINTILWLPENADLREETLQELWRTNGEWGHVYAQMSSLLWCRPYYLPYVEFRTVGDDRLDTLGNLYAVLFGVADEAKADLILDYIRDYGVARPYPCKACYPPVLPGHPDWREYYRNRGYSQPHSAHNGGIWPFIGGFYVAALAACGRVGDALAELEVLARANEQDDWSFNELLHGESGRPIGARHQAWSAAMYVAAYKAAVEGVPLFE